MPAITLASLGPAEDLATVDDILACSDIPEFTVRVPWWKARGSGRPMAIRVRGLSLAQQEQIRAAAARAVPKEDQGRTRQHWPTFVRMTLAAGIVSPAFTYEQARRLEDKNATAAERLAEFVWAISAIDQDQIDSIVSDLAALDAIDSEPDPTDPDRA